MLKRFDLSKMVYQDKNSEGKFECLLPVYQDGRLSVEVRSEEDVLVSLVTGDGEFVPLATGRIVTWSGKVENCSAVQIAASTGFWHRCLLSKRWFDIVDPTPMVVEMTITQEDVLRNMIEDRLRRYVTAEKLNRELTEEEKDDLILDLARGDLEFENEPDEFGLGYQERLQEFIAKQSEPAPAPEAATAPLAEKPAAEAGNSSST